MVPADPLTLAAARVHEAAGRGRRAFAQFQAMQHAGPIIWIVPSHIHELPMLMGLPNGVGERVTLLRPVGEGDLLWCIEETLRSAAVGLVIAEPEKSLSLTAGRRLQLAAEAGRTTGLMLIHQDNGSNATETRWACDTVPAPTADSTFQRWTLTKNKRGTLGSWVINWDGTSAAFNLVSEAGERRQSPQTST